MSKSVGQFFYAVGRLPFRPSSPGLKGFFLVLLAKLQGLLYIKKH